MYNTDLPSRAELPSAARLLKSTAAAALVAAGLLLTTVLPAEYGIDPTGVGRALGLTQMGEIKMSLAAEARAEAAAPDAGVAAPASAALADPQPVAAASVASNAAAATPAGVPEAAAPSAGAATAAESVVANADAAETVAASTAASAETAEPAAGQRHTLSFTLKPDQAAEIKLVMRKEARVAYEWSAGGGRVNFDTHGDPFGAPRTFYHGYGKGRNAAGDAGTLEAAFDGKHGWFWRNRSGVEVTVTLTTSGDYEGIERVL